MEAAAKAFQTILAAFPEEDGPPIKGTLLAFVRQLEVSYAETYDIVAFIYALRCFFCWPPTEELMRDSITIEEVRDTWVGQNDKAYSDWLASMNDDLRPLKWAKWTFQAKMSILNEFANQCLRETRASQEGAAAAQ